MGGGWGMLECAGECSEYMCVKNEEGEKSIGVIRELSELVDKILISLPCSTIRETV